MTRLTWTAAKDGIAHASKTGHSLTLCGQRAQDWRWAWPAQSRCGPCELLAANPGVRLVDATPPHNASGLGLGAGISGRGASRADTPARPSFPISLSKGEPR